MNTPFSDELKKGVKKGLWAPLLPFMKSSTTSIEWIPCMFPYTINMKKEIWVRSCNSSQWGLHHGESYFPGLLGQYYICCVIIAEYNTYHASKKIINTLQLYILCYTKLIKFSILFSFQNGCVKTRWIWSRKSIIQKKREYCVTSSVTLASFLKPKIWPWFSDALFWVSRTWFHR